LINCQILTSAIAVARYFTRP